MNTYTMKYSRRVIIVCDHCMCACELQHGLESFGRYYHQTPPTLFAFAYQVCDAIKRLVNEVTNAKLLTGSHMLYNHYWPSMTALKHMPVQPSDHDKSRIKMEYNAFH